MRTRALFSTFIFLSVKNRKINEHMGPDFNRCSTCTLEKLLTVFRSSVFGTLAVTMVAPSEPLCCFLPFSLPGTVYQENPLPLLQLVTSSLKAFHCHFKYRILFIWHLNLWQLWAYVCLFFAPRTSTYTLALLSSPFLDPA